MIKKAFLILATALSLMAPASAVAFADAQSSIQCGVNATAGAAPGDCSTNPTPPKTLGDMLATVINILSLITGALAVIMIIVGGFRYVTSAGNDNSTAAARKTITYALIGLAIVAVAQVAVHFVLNNVP
jgi:hypothetical protein